MYNAIGLIESFLRDLQQQAFSDHEIVILDSCSTDGTSELIIEEQKKNKKIIHVRTKDKGIYDAMNNGIEKANGEWLYFMGCDDRLYNHEVLSNITPVLINQYDVVYGNVIWVPENKLEEGLCTPENLLNKNINHQRIFYRKELFRQYGGYDLQYEVASDHELNIRFFCNKSIRKKYIPLTVANYHSGGFSANKTDHRFWNNFKTIFKNNFSKHLSPEKMYSKLGWYCRYNIDQHNYRKAFVLFWDVVIHNFSPGFVLLTWQQLIQSFKK